MSILRDRYGHVRLGWELVFALLIAGLVVAAVGWVVLSGFVKPGCLRTADGLGLRADWGVVTGCRVEVNGVLVPLDRIRINDQGEVLP